jgi:hypothetical protein
MAHTYMLFDFGSDEEKAQEARHKLDVWKQAFRLDQKVQYKLDRPEEDSDEDGEEDDAEDSSAKTAAKPKSKAKAPAAKSAKSDEGTKDDENGPVSLLVRLYFSAHEKLSEQQWLERIPGEEPFKSASAKIIRKGQAGFDEADQQFGDVDKTTGRRS